MLLGVLRVSFEFYIIKNVETLNDMCVRKIIRFVQEWGKTHSKDVRFLHIIWYLFHKFSDRVVVFRMKTRRIIFRAHIFEKNPTKETRVFTSALTPKANTIFSWNKNETPHFETQHHDSAINDDLLLTLMNKHEKRNANCLTHIQPWRARKSPPGFFPHIKPTKTQFSPFFPRRHETVTRKNRRRPSWQRLKLKRSRYRSGCSRRPE